MIKYVETHAAKCGIPPQISDQLKNGHKNTENMQKKVCDGGAAGTAKRTGRSEPERSAGLVGGASGGDAHEEGRQHLRYPERQRPYPMTAIDERRGRPRCRRDRQLGRHPRAAMVAALSAALPSRPADRILAVADAVLVVGGAGRRRDRPHIGRLPLIIALFFVGAFAMRGAGCTWNDITDRDLDAHGRTDAVAADTGGTGERAAGGGLSGRSGADRTGGAAAVQPLRDHDRHRLARHRRGLSVHEADYLVAADRARAWRSPGAR